MKEEKLNTFEKTTEAIGWVQIFLSPFIIGIILSAIIYFSHPNTFTLIISIVILALGFTIGVKLASKIKKENGTINFLSNTTSTPDFDDKLKIKKNDPR